MGDAIVGGDGNDDITLNLTAPCGAETATTRFA